MASLQVFLCAQLCRVPKARANKFNMLSSVIQCGVGSLNLLDTERDKKKLRILIAGGGVGGLVLALAAKNRGFEVQVFEKELSAVRGEGQHRGPIQLQSNALEVLDAIDKDVAKQIMDAGCITGNRISTACWMVNQVTVVLEDGRKYEGDLSVGADGIWSKVWLDLAS
ncbi:hypothetical protein NE237_010079 [Protea cynaroides]|uniref:Zeaxanthin epoxidase n=1 Tax=Protea cynaroides TaxID=273540 RepID=A0A9Q0KZS3_9MAGN|nr:hypothetical protein NE237_010079 [Protea cynaroides]